MSLIKKYLENYNIKTHDNFRDFLKLNDLRITEYKTKIIYKNLVIRYFGRGSKSLGIEDYDKSLNFCYKYFRKELQEYYKDIIIFEDYLIRLKTADIPPNYNQAILKVIKMFNIKNLDIDRCDLKRQGDNIRGDTIIDEDSFIWFLQCNDELINDIP